MRPKVTKSPRGMENNSVRKKILQESRSPTASCCVMFIRVCASIKLFRPFFVLAFSRSHKKTGSPFLYVSLPARTKALKRKTVSINREEACGTSSARPCIVSYLIILCQGKPSDPGCNLRNLQRWHRMCRLLPFRPV